MDPILAIVFILILVLFEALFVAAEIALVTVRRTRMEQLAEEGHKGARRVLRLISRPGRFLAVIQIGITFVALLASAFAAESQTSGLRAFFASIPILAPYANGLALIIVTAIISLITSVTPTAATSPHTSGRLMSGRGASMIVRPNATMTPAANSTPCRTPHPIEPKIHSPRKRVPPMASSETA